MRASEATARKVKCHLCGERREPPDFVAALVWAMFGCEECLIKHDERARVLLSAAELIDDGTEQ